MNYQTCTSCHRTFPDDEIILYCPDCGTDTMKPAETPAVNEADLYAAIFKASMEVKKR